jgi:cytochrome b
MAAHEKVKVWDIGVRVFHWALVICIVGAFVTIKTNQTTLHSYFGYTILTLILFRLIWGFAGGTHARFTSFIAGPSRVIAYLKTTFKRDSEHAVGHNPIGGLSVIAMILAIGFQAASGLFINDDITFEGPLFAWVGKELSDKLTGWHKLNEKIIMALVLVHLSAIIFHKLFKKESLVKPMFTGNKVLPAGTPASRGGSASLALIILLLCAVAVYFGIRLRP